LWNDRLKGIPYVGQRHGHNYTVFNIFLHKPTVDVLNAKTLKTDLCPFKIYKKFF
jgi:hypothetical protein